MSKDTNEDEAEEEGEDHAPSTRTILFAMRHAPRSTNAMSSSPMWALSTTLQVSAAAVCEGGWGSYSVSG